LGNELLKPYAVVHARKISRLNIRSLETFSELCFDDAAISVCVVRGRASALV
jgi:hypothetical protein